MWISDVKEIERVGFKTVLSKGHFGVHELDEETMQGMRDWLALAGTQQRLPGRHRDHVGGAAGGEVCGGF